MITAEKVAHVATVSYMLSEALSNAYPIDGNANLRIIINFRSSKQCQDAYKLLLLLQEIGNEVDASFPPMPEQQP